MFTLYYSHAARAKDDVLSGLTVAHTPRKLLDHWARELQRKDEFQPKHEIEEVRP